MPAAQPASARIADSLRTHIVDGTLAPGVQVRQEIVAAQFGVSRVPVREALRQLEAEGLIRTELHRGAFVATLDPSELIEMLDIRIGLERRALQLALPRFDRTAADEASRILDRYDGSESPQAWRDLNLAFHLALYRPAQSPRLIGMIENLVLGTDRFLRTYMSATLGRDGPQSEHRRLLAHCVAHEETEALTLLEAHITRTQAVLRTQLA